MTDPKAIAAGLSVAQINLLAFWPKGHYDEGAQKALARMALIDGCIVTPLGLAVRNALQE